MDEIYTLYRTPETADLQGMLGLLEHAATVHAERLGNGDKRMRENHNCVWMVARVWLRLLEPAVREEIEIRTWNRPVTRGMCQREFDLFFGDRLIAEAAQDWILVDLDTRRMKNMTEIPELLQSPNRTEGKQMPIRRPAVPKDVAYLTTVQVRPDDIDQNGHLNNTKYPGYALSALPPAPVQELTLSYSRECFAGDALEIWGKIEPNCARLEGRVAGELRFDMLAQFF